MGKNEAAAPLRVDLYIRVSGQEQAIKGLSLEAQQEDLEEYARERGWVIVGVYIDAAKTARKRLGKRTNFLRMLEDVKQDKVDLILFTRLDRWFRSVADYYKVMEILDAHNCGWLTTQEQYDTTTAGGRLYINLCLSIAQNEADLCGERIGVVLDSKVKHGTVVSGKIPFGYRINEERNTNPELRKIGFSGVSAFFKPGLVGHDNSFGKRERETVSFVYCGAAGNPIQ
jgi:site-specific DNA recombinase|nr:recombinase family protein [uncultured Oscillibacter sp.]